MSLDSIDETLRKAFETAWREGRPEPIERFLPPEDDARHAATLEELVHIELEFTWKSWRSVPHDAATLSPANAPTETRAGPPRVESYLKRFPRLDQPEIVVRLLEQEHLVRTNWGDRPSLAEYHQRFPDMIPPDWQPSTEATDQDNAKTIFAGAVLQPDVTDLPRSFGNYELLDEIGRGGMGVVYRARQVAADRTVALKLVRRDYLESLAQDTKASALERFHQEVQATARLDHKSIVSVYEVGDVNGEPFFSMQYIEGKSLAQVLRDGPVSNRDAAKYMVEVARAVAEAHRQDILHRDIKPQNILIDGQADRPLVADFGLAKMLSSNEDLTRSGDIMGSPPYMSPEQARDSSKVTTRSDIYALGATLYHVLTGRPPFQAATALETMLLVTNQEPVPPRQLNPTIDRDLETICLKCLEKEPARRYDSAATLAEEFRRYLNNEPIVARPVGTIGRTVRWCRRNPVTATLITSTVAFLILALVATFVGYIHTTAALRVAEASFQHARQTVDDFCTNVSENILLNQPNMQPLRRELLEQALGYYQQFLEERGDDPTIRDELALTYFRIGQISELIDAPDDALAAYREALTMQEQLVAVRPKDRELLDALGNTYTKLGGVLLNQKKWDEVADAYSQATDIRQRLVAAYPEEMEYQRKLANTIMNIGVMENQRGNLDGAGKKFTQAQTQRRQILDQDPNATKVRRDMAMGCFNLANLNTGDLKASQAYFDEAIELFAQAGEEDPDDLMIPYYLAVCFRLRGALNEDSNNSTAAKEDYQRALARMEQLALENPAVTEFRAGLARVNIYIGRLHKVQQDQPAAQAALTRALRLLEDVVTQCPQTPNYERDLASTLYLVAEIEFAQSNFDAARKYLSQARDRFDWLQEKFPGDPAFRVGAARANKLLGFIHNEQKDPSAALAALTRALQLLEELVRQYPQTPDYEHDAAITLYLLATVENELSELAAAREHLKQAKERFDWLHTNFPQEPEYKQRLEEIQKFLTTLEAPDP